MRRVFKYILPMFCLLSACQEVELPERPLLPPGEGVYGEALVSFTIVAPEVDPLTKAPGDMSIDPDIQTLHLVIFDESGYLVETREAHLADVVGDHNDHKNERKYEVMLTLTDQPRRIHFIGNCPVDQIRPGMDTDIISNMYVTDAPESDGYKTKFKSAYWALVLVDEIMLDSTSGEDQLTEHDKFVCVPLLRNFSRVTVVDGNEDDYFTLESFAVYNTTHIGTVAPYNENTRTFQSFAGPDGMLHYEDFLDANYEGHALARVELDTRLTESHFIQAGQPFYMYERRISVRTDQEEMWDESPSHIIIKGQYKDNTMQNAVDTYYKVDLIRTLDEGETQYYNILRNFAYRYTIKGTFGRGYDSYEEAKSKPAGNNLSGSSDTQGYTNISDGTGRIFVNYTNKTLVSNKDVELKVKYIPNISNGVVDNSKIDLRAITGNHEVLTELKSTSATDSDGWMTLTFGVQDPAMVKKYQEIQLHVSDNPNLHRTIRYTLRMPFLMTLTLADYTIDKGYAQPVQMTVQIPNDLTEDMFPMDFLIETDEMSLSPNFTLSDLPVHIGKSIVPGKTGQTYQFVYSLVTIDDYKALKVDDGDDNPDNDEYYFTTHWYTSVEDIIDKNATIYVANDYFATAKIQYTINN